MIAAPVVPSPRRTVGTALDHFDAIVVGGGVVGMSVGLLKLGHSVCVLDEGDVAPRARRGNFGLAWVQGKGANHSDYAHWSIDAAAMWPGFAAAPAGSRSRF